MTTRVVAAVVMVAGPPDVIVFQRAEPTTAGTNRAPAAKRPIDSIDIDRSGKPFLIRFFRELR
ncbi:MAG: hypothetical protein WD184_10995 [Acidimicrobiia bacterium]